MLKVQLFHICPWWHHFFSFLITHHFQNLPSTKLYTVLISISSVTLGFFLLFIFLFCLLIIVFLPLYQYMFHGLHVSQTILTWLMSLSKMIVPLFVQHLFFSRLKSTREKLGLETSRALWIPGHKSLPVSHVCFLFAGNRLHSASMTFPEFHSQAQTVTI